MKWLGSIAVCAIGLACAPPAAPRPEVIPCSVDEPEGACPEGRVCAAGACVVDLDLDAPVPSDIGTRWDEVWQFLADNYGAFEAKPDVDWDAVRTETAAELEAATSALQADDIVQRAVGRLSDGHTAAFPTTICEIDPGFDQGVTNTGACVVEVDGQLVVNSALGSSGLVQGDVLLGIDGRGTERLLDDLDAQLRCRQGGSTEAQRRAQRVASVMFRAPEERLALVLRDGEVLAVPLSAEADARCTGRVAPEGNTADAAGVETATLDEGIAYLHFARFGTDTPEGFVAEPMLVSLRQAIADAVDAPGIVIDLRGNGGGYTTILQALASFLHDIPVDLYQCRLRSAGTLGPPFTVDAEPDPGLFYSGPVAIISDARTFSAADFAGLSLGTNLGRATLVGTRSAGGFGSAFFANAGGYLLGYNPLQCEDGFGGTLEGRPPAVDVEVTHTLADIRAGRDAVIEAARLSLLD